MKDNIIYDDLNAFCGDVHKTNVEAGWWDDLERISAQLPDEKDRKIVEQWCLATKICLMHSELSEMMEGLRKGIPDDKLPHLPMEEVEGADVFIRLADYFGFRKFSLGTSVFSKMAFNLIRADHKKENRDAPGGKGF